MAPPPLPMASLLPLFFEVGSPSFWYLIPEPARNSYVCFCCISESLIKYIEMLPSLGNHWIDKVGLQKCDREGTLPSHNTIISGPPEEREEKGCIFPSLTLIHGGGLYKDQCLILLCWTFVLHMFSLGPNSIRSYLTLQSTLHNHVAAHVIYRSALWEVTSPDLFSVMIRK